MPGRAKAKGETKAKAKAQAHPPRPLKSLRQSRRRDAVRLLNGLMSEVQLAAPRLPARTATPAQFEHVVRKLEPRCQAADLLSRLRGAAKQWADNGGELTRALLPDPDQGGPDGKQPETSPVVQHRVLEPGFILRSRGFMATYNNRAWTRAVWSAFEMWVKSLKPKLGFHAWGACFPRTIISQGRNQLEPGFW